VLREARALALDELRELSQGIRAAILVERGLAAALDGLSRQAALPVRLDAAIAGRLLEQVEAAAYFVASEALTNAAKHSHANEVRLAFSCDRGTLWSSLPTTASVAPAAAVGRDCAASPTGWRRSAGG
jgi:signal transduction histidine kinase